VQKVALPIAFLKNLGIDFWQRFGKDGLKNLVEVRSKQDWNLRPSPGR
jgi:hypothetical protein